MAPAAVAVPADLSGAGFLFIAPLASTGPTNTVSGSVFTGTWPVAWLPLGATSEGTEFSYTTTVEGVEVAEFFDPIRHKTTSREGSVSFNLASYTATNLQ